jgi:hypothetical protein
MVVSLISLKWKGGMFFFFFCTFKVFNDTDIEMPIQMVGSLISLKYKRGISFYFCTFKVFNDPVI